MVIRGTAPGAQRARGFTLLELMTVVAIVGILATLAFVSFTDTVRNSRIRTATFELYSSLTFARSEAIKRNTDVNVVPVAGVWNNGWNVEFGAGATVLRSQDPLPAPISIAGPAGALTYRSDGRLTAPPAIATFSLFVSGVNNIPRRCVNISVSGQANIQHDYNRDGNCANG